jgi:hypothetical protein
MMMMKNRTHRHHLIQKLEIPTSGGATTMPFNSKRTEKGSQISRE